MAKQRRVYNNYPESLRTRQNNRETFVADDLLFEPEQANFLNGFIGDASILTDEDLARKPVIFEMSPERQKYQLSVGSNYIDPDSQDRVSAAFYTDLINQISINGGDVSDPNRILATNFYAWTPPIDYDKHINFGRYRWTGIGAADVQGEYMTIEPSHSKTVIYEWDGTSMTMKNVRIVDGLPAIEPVETFIEDASVSERFIYRSDGVSWQLLDLEMVDEIPTSTATLDIPSYFYVTRTGPEYNRPLVWKFSAAAGRWIPQPVVVSISTPETLRENMIWEDVRTGSERIFKIAKNSVFIDLTYTVGNGPPGTPGVDGEYVYDIRNFTDLDANSWEANNWWRHHEDLSPIDASRSNEDQATRPILEFWNGLEHVPGDVRDARNDSPVFKKYAYDLNTDEIVDTGEGTTIFEYQEGSGRDDFVLGFPLVFNNSGEFLFDLTLESDTSAYIGYKYFKDTNTDAIHGIWFKSDELTNQTVDANGLYEIPVGISSNSNHEVLVNPSRSQMLRHMTNIMKEQDSFTGSEFGLNSYRWTNRNPAIGATIIDAEQTHLRTLATLQSDKLDLPNAIRAMAKEYNKVLFRFTNRLNQYWDSLMINDGSGNLVISASEAVDGILTTMFVGRTEDFPFFLSDMGTFLETTIESGSANVIDTNPKPIFIAPSPARVGTSATYVPEMFMEQDGTMVLRGHDGVVVPAFGDDRDLVWLELQTRFFNAVPLEQRLETATYSTRFAPVDFFLQDYYGNLTPNTSTEPVDEVVTDYLAIVGPSEGIRVFSATQAIIAVFSGGQWLTREALTDEVFFNNDDNEYYIFNGKGVNLINRWNNPFDFDYTTNEFREIVRRDFERFILNRIQDFSENTTFDESNRFTWNYRSAGIEGHYKGIYARIYNTVRPHSHSWEVMGYFIEPDWWRTQYVPDSIAADNTPRYGNAHAMWSDFAAGIVAHPSGNIQRNQFLMTAPIPVDGNGELLDPIAAGVVDEGKLDKERIDDLWVYGDGAPEEQAFLTSPHYAFSVSLAGYLMKNGIWMDTLWTENYIGIGDNGSNVLFRAPHAVHKTTLTRPKISALPVHLERNDNDELIQRIGVNAWISEFVSINGGNPETDFGRVVRNTSPALGWKTSGFINQNRTVISTLSRNEIPFTDVHVLLHKSQPIKSTFCSGVLITRESPNGFRVFGFDPFDPVFTVERPAIPIVGGQVVLTEEFTVEYIDNDAPNVTGGSVYPNQTLQRTFEVTEFRLPRVGNALDTARLSVIINGFRIKPQFITVNAIANTITIESTVALEAGDEVSVQAITTQSNASTQTRQFVVNDVSFPYFATGTGEFERIEYGRFFETSTEVINFLIGYGRFLVSEGWVFDDVTDAGSTRDWLLGAQIFARWVLEIQSAWNPNPQLDVLEEDMFFYSPIQNTAKFKSEFGQGLNVESIMNGAFGILNRRSEPIEVDETFVSRIDDEVTVERRDLTNTDSEIYGVRINLIEIEHAVLFSNITRFNDIIYDPVTGLAQRTLIVDSYRTLNWQGRAEANGYVIDGGTLLPNFEKQAFDLTRLYDRFNPIDDVTKRSQARNLYGYVPANQSRFADPSKSVSRRVTSDSSQYMIPIGASDRSSFDYFRGMIQTNATVRPIYAFARGTIMGRDNFSISEDWAWKLQRYGDTRKERVQFSVDKNDFRSDTQVVQFGGPNVVTNKTIEILDFDRNDLEADGDRWILPPEQCDFASTCNLKFPIDRDTDFIDVKTYSYYAELYDTETGIGIINHFHYDPQLDRFNPEARSEIEYETALDPARYNVVPAGSGIPTSENHWGANQVGLRWWRQDRKLFVDYRRLIPDYEDTAAVWGKPLFYKANITRTDDVVSVELFQFDDLYKNGTPANLTTELGLVDTDEFEISIRKADQPEYNLTNIVATITGATTGLLEFTVTTGPDTPATGDVEVVFGHMDIYEWIESTVLPQEWVSFVANINDPTHPNGTPLNGDDAPFVQIDEELNDGRVRTLYYFWVLNSTGNNTRGALPLESDPGRKLTAFQVSQRLTNPTARGLAWFAPVDIDHMIIHTDGEQVLNGFGFEILIDQRRLQTHHEFVLISENNRFFPVPGQISDKMIDSLSGQDDKGNVVPSPLLEVTERFGSCFFPIQTVFRDRAAAVSVYLTAVNRILKRKDLIGFDGLTGIFRTSDEYNETTNPTGFWNKTAYRDPSITDFKVLDTVASIAERDRRLSIGLYVEGDLIKVLESGFDDAWNGNEVAAIFQVRDGAFFPVEIDNRTAVINDNIDNNPTTYRNHFFLVYDLVLEIIEQNELMFSLLHEMMIQNPDPSCDWFFKTSYVTTQVSTLIDNSPFVRADETIAIRDALLSSKPYRTKLRSEINTIGGIEEDMPVELLEIPEQKITLVADRLSCNMLDDFGWDVPAWDTKDIPTGRWDYATWNFIDLGRQDYYLVDSFVGNSVQTIFEINALFDPTLYNVKLEVRNNGELQPSLAAQMIVTKTHTKIIVNTVFALGPSFTVDVFQAHGFYAENDPSFIGTTMEGSLFQPAPSDYKHAVARSLRTVASHGEFFDPRTQMIGCTDINDPLGGRPEERVVTEVLDSVNICVINDHSSSLAGWDATPWDVSRWDQGPGNVGRRVFIISIGNQEDIPIGPEAFNTSEDINITDPLAIIGTSPDSFTLVQVEVRKNGAGPYIPLTENVEYESLGIFNNAIKTKTPPAEVIIPDLVESGDFDVDADLSNVFAPEQNEWFAVTWSPDLNLFAAISKDGTNQVMTSSDGVNWTLRNAAENNDWRAITWSPDLGLFAAVSIDGTNRVMTSPDGITWTARSAAEANSWRGIAWSSSLGLFAAVSLDGANRVMTSPDGITWTSRSASAANSWRAITWSPEVNVFVAVAPDGANRVMTSSDGITWTGRLAAEANEWTSVAWSPELGLFAAVSANGVNRVMTSPTGITWTARNAAQANPWWGITWAPEPGLFIAVAATGVDKVMTSLDGINWEAHNISGGSSWNDIIWSSSLETFVAVATSGSNRIMNGTFTVTPILVYSTDFQTTSGTEIATVHLDGYLLAEGTDYTLDASRTQITFITLPSQEQEILVGFVSFIEVGDVVRYRYNGWIVGPEGRFTISPLSGGLIGNPYDVFRGVLTFENLPAANEFVTLSYTQTRKNGLPESILVRMPEIVADIQVTHTVYDSPTGFNGYRPNGTRIINTTTNQVFEWNGVEWIPDLPIAPGTQFFVTRTQEIWEYDGTSFNKLFEVGDAFTKPPVVDYPLFGEGITYATYAFGQSSNASVEYPDAYQIIQHPGDCPP